jgi:hypothetical protein
MGVLIRWAERARSGRARQYLEHHMARKTSLACAVAAGETPGHPYGLGVKSYAHPSTPTPHVGLWTSQFSRDGRATSHPCKIIAPIFPSCTPCQNHNSPGRQRVPIGVALVTGIGARSPYRTHLCRQLLPKAQQSCQYRNLPRWSYHECHVLGLLMHSVTTTYHRRAYAYTHS